MEICMSNEVEFLKLVYDRFNARDMETVLAAMHEDVMWANGMEGGHVRGRDEQRKAANLDRRRGRHPRESETCPPPLNKRQSV